MPPSKKSTTKAAAEPKVEVKVEVPVAAETPAVVEIVDDLSTAHTDFMAKLTSLRQQMASVMTDFKALQKKSDREFKAAQKASNRRRNKNANRAPSGFVKPTLISDQLATFLSKPKGTLIARTEVTREINAYIRAHSLQDPANGRKINPDDKLKKLLTLKPTDELTYFNLQRFMSQHFQKTVVPATA